jgi:glycine cleavage system aminomethyltransferase T
MAWAVKLDKADFLGHRSLSRIAETGSPQKLTGFTLDRPDVVPEEGLQIVQPNPDHPLGLEIIGWVTSCRHSPTLNKTIGLCWLPAELAEQENAAFTIYRDGEMVQATVHQGAFYDPEGERLRM